MTTGKLHIDKLIKVEISIKTDDGEPNFVWKGYARKIWLNVKGLPEPDFIDVSVYPEEK